MRNSKCRGEFLCLRGYPRQGESRCWSRRPKWSLLLALNSITWPSRTKPSVKSAEAGNKSRNHPPLANHVLQGGDFLDWVVPVLALQELDHTSMDIFDDLSCALDSRDLRAIDCDGWISQQIHRVKFIRWLKPYLPDHLGCNKRSASHRIAPLRERYNTLRLLHLTAQCRSDFDAKEWPSLLMTHRQEHPKPSGQ